jgi:hypothetical protein
MRRIAVVVSALFLFGFSSVSRSLDWAFTPAATSAAALERAADASFLGDGARLFSASSATPTTSPTDAMPALLASRALQRIRSLAAARPASPPDSVHAPSRSAFVMSRGVSWLYYNLGGLLLGSPQLERLKRTSVRLARPGNVSFDIEAVQPGPCEWRLAHQVSIWVRLAGPEIRATLAAPVEGRCAWRATFFLSESGTYTAYARLLHFGARPRLQSSRCDQLRRTRAVAPHLSVLFAAFSANANNFTCEPQPSSLPLTDLRAGCATCERFGDCVDFSQDFARNICTGFAEPGFELNSSSVAGLPSVWQLGCGPTEGIEQHFRCGSATNFAARNQSFTEDVVRCCCRRRLVAPALTVCPGLVRVGEPLASARR